MACFTRDAVTGARKLAVTDTAEAPQTCHLHGGIIKPFHYQCINLDLFIQIYSCILFQN